MACDSFPLTKRSKLYESKAEQLHDMLDHIELMACSKCKPDPDDPELVNPDAPTIKADA